MFRINRQAFVVDLKGQIKTLQAGQGTTFVVAVAGLLGFQFDGTVVIAQGSIEITDHQVGCTEAVEIHRFEVVFA